MNNLFLFKPLIIIFFKPLNFNSKLRIFTLQLMLFILILKSKLTPYIYILLFFLPFCTLSGQDFGLNITSNKSEELKVINTLTYKNSHINKTSALNEIKLFNKKLEINGFLNYEADSIIKDSTYTITYSLGNQIKKIKIFHPQNLNINILKKISDNFNNQFFEINYSDLDATLNTIVLEFEKIGKTFIKASLNNIFVSNDLLTADLKLNILNFSGLPIALK